MTSERIAEIVADACLLADRDQTTKFSAESPAESVERGVKEMRAEIDRLRTVLADLVGVAGGGEGFFKKVNAAKAALTPAPAPSRA